MKKEDLSGHALAIFEGLSKDEKKDWLNGEGIDPFEIASYVDDNWFDITGLTNRDKDEEQDFPWEVYTICEELGYEDDLGDAWSSVREGADDWEPYFCECGEELDWDADEDDLCEDCQNAKEDEEDED